MTFLPSPLIDIPPKGRTLGNILVDDLASRVHFLTKEAVQVTKDNAVLRILTGVSRDARSRWIRDTLDSDRFDALICSLPDAQLREKNAKLELENAGLREDCSAFISEVEALKSKIASLEKILVRRDNVAYGQRTPRSIAESTWQKRER